MKLQYHDTLYIHSYTTSKKYPKRVCVQKMGLTRISSENQFKAFYNCIKYGNRNYAFTLFLETTKIVSFDERDLQNNPFTEDVRALSWSSIDTCANSY